MTVRVKRAIFADQILGIGRRQGAMEYQDLPVSQDPKPVGLGSVPALRFHASCCYATLAGNIHRGYDSDLDEPV